MYMYIIHVHMWYDWYTCVHLFQLYVTVYCSLFCYELLQFTLLSLMVFVLFTIIMFTVQHLLLRYLITLIMAKSRILYCTYSDTCLIRSPPCPTTTCKGTSSLTIKTTIEWPMGGHYRQVTYTV